MENIGDFFLLRGGSSDFPCSSDPFGLTGTFLKDFFSKKIFKDLLPSFFYLYIIIFFLLGNIGDFMGVSAAFMKDLEGFGFSGRSLKLLQGF